jgi:hypothetical protein
MHRAQEISLNVARSDCARQGVEIAAHRPRSFKGPIARLDKKDRGASLRGIDCPLGLSLCGRDLCRQAS